MKAKRFTTPAKEKTRPMKNRRKPGTPAEIEVTLAGKKKWMKGTWQDNPSVFGVLCSAWESEHPATRVFDSPDMGLIPYCDNHGTTRTPGGKL